MRAVRLAGSVAGVLLLGLSAWAQTPTTRTITVPEAQVRSGPSPEFYVTNTLRQGQTVEVRGEDSGWLAITPPPGSWSWVNSSRVEQRQDNRHLVVVTQDDTPIRVGSAIHQQEPTVERVKVPHGTILTLVGGLKTENDGSWFAVVPPPSEVRFIPADAVKPTAAVATPTTSSSFSPPAGPSPGQTQPAAPGVDPRYTRATQMDQSGNYPEAIRLYRELAKEIERYDPALALQYYRRAQYLQDVQEGRVQRQATTAQYSPSRDATSPAQAAGISQPITPAGAPNGGGPAISKSGAGRLYRTAFQIDGKSAYGLDQGAGKQPLYIVPQAGLSLEPFLNRNVELYGTLTYRPELRNYQMTAVQVIQLP
jgi:uncharacterized protein YraI